MSLKKERYLQYISSKDWQKKRVECFKLFGKRCFVCKKDKEIHVHHKTYKRLFNEKVATDLVPLCAKHHKALHKFCRKKNLNLFEGSQKYIESWNGDSYREKRRFEKIRKRKKRGVNKENRKDRKLKKKQIDSKAALPEWKENLKLLADSRSLSKEEIYERMRERLKTKQYARRI